MTCPMRRPVSYLPAPRRSAPITTSTLLEIYEVDPDFVVRLVRQFCADTLGQPLPTGIDMRRLVGILSGFRPFNALPSPQI